MARKPDPAARDCILDVAARLFYEQGVHAVGLQQVIDEYGCGKNLLYREFPSKDDLVVAWLERSYRDWDAHMAEITAPHADDPAAQLVAIIRSAADEVAQPGYRGCSLRKTHLEFPDPGHPAHRIAVRYVEDLRHRLHDLAHRAGARDPDVLADRLLLILDGLLTNGAVLGASGAAGAAVGLAEELVREATAPQVGSRANGAKGKRTVTL
jgi:AcrR family transcriptional regulator